jgi:hypothetical protein
MYWFGDPVGCAMMQQILSSKKETDGVVNTKKALFRQALAVTTSALACPRDYAPTTRAAVKKN